MSDSEDHLSSDDDFQSHAHLFKSSLDIGSHFIDIEPENELVFYNREGTLLSQLTVKNVTSKAYVAFLIFTSAPYPIVINPRFGFIPPMHQQTIQIGWPHNENPDADKLSHAMFFVKALPISQEMNVIKNRFLQCHAIIMRLQIRNNAGNYKIFILINKYQINMNSNRNLIEDGHKDSLRNLLNDLKKDQNSFPFLEPVNWEVLGLHDYPTVIKKPMDMLTVKKNLDKGRYRYFEEIFADIQLIWSNCKTYNVSGSEIFRLAENMERRSKKLIKELRSALKLENGAADPSNAIDDNLFQSDEDMVVDEIAQEENNKDSKKSKLTGGAATGSSKLGDDEDDDFGYDPERYVPFDEKVEFADLMKRATKEGLTQIVNYLLEKQPEAVEDYGNERLQIKVDLIEKQAFTYCKDLLTQNIKEAPQKRQKK